MIFPVTHFKFPGDNVPVSLAKETAWLRVRMRDDVVVGLATLAAYFLELVAHASGVVVLSIRTIKMSHIIPHSEYRVVQLGPNAGL
jgi:hypothetical protein